MSAEERVTTNTFTAECSCGRTYHVVNGIEQPHPCATSVLLDAWHDACHNGMTNIEAVRHQEAALRDAGLLAEPPLAEWHCPSCGAVTRARMADAEPGGLVLTAEQVRKLREWRDNVSGPAKRFSNEYLRGTAEALVDVCEYLGLTNPESEEQP